MWESKRGDAGSEVWESGEGGQKTGVWKALERRRGFDGVEMVSRALADLLAHAGGSRQRARRADQGAL